MLFRSTKTNITRVVFTDLEQTRPETLEREYFFRSDSGLPVDHIPTAEARLNRLEYITFTPKGIFRGDQDRFLTVYQAHESSALQIDGLIGAERPPGVDSVRWIGRFHLDIPNLMGTGRKIRIQWERTRADQEKFSLAYTEPWLANQPVDGSVGLMREVVNGQYITQSGQVDLDWRISWWQDLVLSWNQTRNILTFEGRQMHPEWTNARRGTFGLGYRLLPPDVIERPFYAGSMIYRLELARRTNAIKQLKVRIIGRWPLTRKFRVTQRFSLGHYQNGNANSDPSLLQPIGGSRSVRGYFEDQFRGTSVVALQNEFAIGIGKRSRVFIFNDYGWFQNTAETRWLHGYGMGARLETNAGPIVISVGKNPDLPWQNALIHLQLAGIDRRWIEN